MFIKIPLTLAIVSSMESGGREIFAIPIANIRESFKATADQVFTDPDNNEMIMLRGTLSVIRLNRVCNIEDGFENEDGVFLWRNPPKERPACLPMKSWASIRWLSSPYQHT